MSSFQSNALQVIIASGQSLSNSIEIGGTALVAIIAATGITASFQGSLDNATFYNIYKTEGSALYTVTCNANGMQTVDLNQFLAPRFIKVRSGTVSDPETVSLDITVTLVTKEI